MCDPTTLGGVLLSGASAYANSQAANQVNSARSRAIADSQARMAAFDAQSAAVHDRARSRYAGFGGQQERRSQQLGDYFSTQGATGAGAPTAMPAGASNIVTQERDRQLDRANAYGSQQAQALGAMRAFGDVLGTANRGAARDAGTAAQIANFRSGTASLLPYALETAGHAGDSMRMFGDVARGLGQIGVNWGLARPSAGTSGGLGSLLPNFNLFGGR